MDSVRAAGDDPAGNPRRGRRRQAVIAVVSLAAVGAFVAIMVVGLLASRGNSELVEAVAAGKARPAPAFTLPILANGRAIGRPDGEMLALDDLRGRAVVLNFWASWCNPCKAEAGRLEDAWQRHRTSGVVVLGLKIQDLSGDALGFIDRYGQTYPHVRDKSDRSYQAYGLTGVPETYFIDADGLVRAHKIGEVSAEQLEAGITAIIRPEDQPQ